MNRNRFAFLLSTVALSMAVVFFRESFFFSKIVSIPAWLGNLPEPLQYFLFPEFTRIVTFLCLIPAAFLPKKTLLSGFAISQTVFLAPLPALLLYSRRIIQEMTDSRVWINIPIQYFFVVLYHFILPAILIFFIRCILSSLYTLFRTSKDS